MGSFRGPAPPFPPPPFPRTGGLAASTKYCNDVNTLTFCSQHFQLEWWAVWFQFFLLIIMLGTCFLNAFERARFIFLAYLALVTSLLTIMVRNFITNSFNTHGGAFVIKDYKQSAYNAAAAGGIMLCVTNYALIIFVGLGARRMGGFGLKDAAP
jgi:hypothetical protein